MNTDSGNPIRPVVLTTPQSNWIDIGSITASQATLAVGARDYSSVVGLTATKTAIWEVPNDISGCFFRFQTGADGNANDLEMYVAAHNNDADGNEDSFTLGAIISSCAGGKQVGPSSNVFVDTIVVTAATGCLSDGTILDTVSDRICMYRVDLQGWKRIVFIAPTVANTLKVEARGY